jgi:hypothetical protein
MDYQPPLSSRLALSSNPRWYNTTYRVSKAFSIMETQSALGSDIAKKVAQFPRLGQKDQSWSITLGKEFSLANENTLAEFKHGPGRLPLYEAKSISLFSHQLARPARWIDETCGRKTILGRTADTGQVCDYQRYRLALRANARNNEERTLVAAILPRNAFAGNSLYASQDPNPGPIELFACAMLCSFTVDYCLRDTASGSLTIAILSQLPVPRIPASDPAFSRIVRRAARLICTTPEFADLWNEVDTAIGLDTSSATPKLGKFPWNPSRSATSISERSRLRAELDGLIAHVYGMTEKEFNHVLSTFPLVAEPITIAARTAYRDVRTGVVR